MAILRVFQQKTKTKIVRSGTPVLRKVPRNVLSLASCLLSRDQPSMQIRMSMKLQADEVVQVADRVPDKMFGTKELQDLVDRMIAAMREAPGVGLAAPQIGVSMQVCCPSDPGHLTFHSLCGSLIPCP